MKKETSFTANDFWSAPDTALFTRQEVAIVRRCTVAKIDRESWLKIGITTIKDGGKVLYLKSDVVKYLESCRTEVTK